jgi:hypothetical protein
MFIDRKEEEDGIVSCLFKSSNILASEYDKENKQLTIVFNEGRSYTYLDVNHKDYHRFEMAESQGQFFNKYIKKYPTKKNSDINPTDLLNRVNEIVSKKK